MLLFFPGLLFFPAPFTTSCKRVTMAKPCNTQETFALDFQGTRETIGFQGKTPKTEGTPRSHSLPNPTQYARVLNGRRTFLLQGRGTAAQAERQAGFRTARSAQWKRPRQPVHRSANPAHLSQYPLRQLPEKTRKKPVPSGTLRKNNIAFHQPPKENSTNPIIMPGFAG
jgi:hypothetical protein